MCLATWLHGQRSGPVPVLGVIGLWATPWVPSLTWKSLHSTLVAQGLSVEEMLQAGSAMGLTLEKGS